MHANVFFEAKRSTLIDRIRGEFLRFTRCTNEASTHDRTNKDARVEKIYTEHNRL